MALVDNQLIFIGDKSPSATPRVITVEYEEEISRPDSNRSIRSRLRSAAELLGWRDTSVQMSAGDLGCAEITELRFQAPDGVGLSQATAVLLSPAGRVERYPAVVNPRSPGRFATAALSSVPAWATGYLQVKMRPDRGYPAAVTLTAVFAAVILTLGRVHLKTIHADAALDPAITLLLAGPTVFAALIAQPGRGSPAARMLVGARFALILAGLWTFTAAAALVSYPYGETLRVMWLVLVIVSWVTAFTLFGVFSPSLRFLRARRQTADPKRTAR